MSVDGSVTLVWGDGENKFRFAIGQFRELQERVNLRRVSIGAPTIGPMFLLNSLQSNDAWPDDVRDIIRLGLLGGGLDAKSVQRLLQNHFDNTGLLNHMRTAHTILLAGLVGAVEEPIESKKKRTPEETEMDLSSSQSSTAPVLQ